MLIRRHGSLSPCQITARTITEEISTISGIDCRDQSTEVSIATIELKRKIINAHLDEMVRIIQQKHQPSEKGTVDASTTRVQWTGGFDKVRTFCLMHGAGRVDLVDEEVRVYVGPRCEKMFKLNYNDWVIVDPITGKPIKEMETI